MITIYSKNECPRCVEAKKLLEQNGFEYDEVNIEENDDARSFLVDHGHRSVPQMYVNNSVFVETVDMLRVPKMILENRLKELE